MHIFLIFNLSLYSSFLNLFHFIFVKYTLLLCTLLFVYFMKEKPLSHKECDDLGASCIFVSSCRVSWQLLYGKTDTDRQDKLNFKKVFKLLIRNPLKIH